MTSRFAPFAAAALVLALMGCGGLPNDNAVDDNGIGNSQLDDVAETASVSRVSAIDLSETTPLLEFQYLIPPEAAAVPAVRDMMTAQAAKLKASALKAAKADEESSRETGFTYRQHSDGTRWSAAADTKGLLALQGEHFFYTGGAHPMTNHLALIYDRKAKQRISFNDLFTDPQQSVPPLAGRYCAALDKEREKRRGGPTNPDELFGDCPKLSEAAMLPASATPGRIDRIRIILDPYVAGPYVEGTYVIELPVDQPMIDAVKPQYRSLFVVR